MTHDLIKMLREFPRPCITDVELKFLLNGTADSRYGKIKRLTQEEKIVRLKRGLYLITPETGNYKAPNLFEIAHFMYNPSCISLESALSYHQLIPEGVYTTTSATSKRTKVFSTPLGSFAFQHMPLKNFYTEVELIADGDSRYFMAKPWRAMCDYVYAYKQEWESFSEFARFLRIEEDDLIVPSYEALLLLETYYEHNRMTRFLKLVKRELM